MLTRDEVMGLEEQQKINQIHFFQQKYFNVIIIATLSEIT